MSSPRRSLWLSSRMLAIFVSETSAQAANLTQTQVDTFHAPDHGIQRPSTVFDQFRPTDGTLNSVQLILEGHLQGSVSLENESAEGQAIITVTLKATLHLEACRRRRFSSTVAPRRARRPPWAASTVSLISGVPRGRSSTAYRRFVDRQYLS